MANTHTVSLVIHRVGGVSDKGPDAILSHVGVA